MGIFGKEDDASIDKQFASILQASEVVLFREFRKGYKDGLKYRQFSQRTSILDRLIGNIRSVAFQNPYDLGFLTGITIAGMMDVSTYENEAYASILCQFINLLNKVPGFNMDVLRKRAKKIDVKRFTPGQIENLKIVLHELSKK